jgi:uncharacterized membrane protein
LGAVDLAEVGFLVTLGLGEADSPSVAVEEVALKKLWILLVVVAFFAGVLLIGAFFSSGAFFSAGVFFSASAFLVVVFLTVVVVFLVAAAFFAGASSSVLRF